MAAGLALPAMADDEEKVDKAPIVLPETPAPVVQGFFDGKKKAAAQDLSGIACRPAAAGGVLDCLSSTTKARPRSPSPSMVAGSCPESHGS
jgi:hypothetical protein